MSSHKLTLLFALLLPACNLYTNRDSARAVTEALQKNTVERETRTLAILNKLIEGRMNSVRDRLRAEFERSVAAMRVKVHEKIEAKRVELATRVKTDIETAIDPVLQQMNADLQSAKQVQGEGAPRLREYTLAAQQASTIAVAQSATFDILEDVDKRLAALRTELDQSITSLAAQADVVPAFDDQVSKLEEQLKTQSKEYVDEINAAHEQLRRYFDTADAPGLIFSGLAKGIGWNLDGLGEKADQLLEKGRNSLSAWVTKTAGDLESSLSSKATSFLADAANKVRKAK